MSDTPVGGTPATYTFGRNVHGDVSLLVNAAGQAKAAYGYRAYGSEDELSQGDTKTSPVNPFRFNDKRWDSGSNSLDMGARRFSPDLGRFIQRDMYADAVGDLDLSTDALTGNRYSFAGGNPIAFTEVDGHGPGIPVIALGREVCQRWGELCRLSFNFPKLVVGDLRGKNKTRAVGVHWTGDDPAEWGMLQQAFAQVKIKRVTPSDPRGVYEADIWIKGHKKYTPKNRVGGSSMFPSKWSLERTLDEIQHAFTPQYRSGGLFYHHQQMRPNPKTGRMEPTGAIILAGWTRGNVCQRILVVGIATAQRGLDSAYPKRDPKRCKATR